MVGSTKKHIQCFKILASAHLKPFFLGYLRRSSNSDYEHLIFSFIIETLFIRLWVLKNPVYPCILGHPVFIHVFWDTMFSPLFLDTLLIAVF